jgi:hypothetical protein
VTGDTTGVADPSKLNDAFAELNSTNALLKSQYADVKRRESELVIRLTMKEKDILNLESHARRLVEASDKRTVHLRATFLDPMLNMNFEAAVRFVNCTHDHLNATFNAPLSSILLLCCYSVVCVPRF